jgi:hypothetical protein
VGGLRALFELLDSIEDMGVVLAFFDGALKGYEEFESGWANVAYLYDLPPAQRVTATFDGLAAEECETGWSNVHYAREWAAVVAATGVFDGEPREDFEDRWRSNQLYAWTWAAVTSSAALFDAGAQAVEDFNNGWTSMTTL